MPWVVKRWHTDPTRRAAAERQLRDDLERIAADLAAATHRFRESVDQSAPASGARPERRPQSRARRRATLHDSPLADLFRATDNRPPAAPRRPATAPPLGGG